MEQTILAIIMIGQQVSLVIGCKKGDVSGVISGVSWSGLNFGTLQKWEGSLAAGTSTALSSADFALENIKFYFVAPGTYDVSVTFTVTFGGNSAVCTKNITLTAVSPTTSFDLPTAIGPAMPNVDKIRIQVREGDGMQNGANFRGIVNDGGLGGSWQYVQLLTPEITSTLWAAKKSQRVWCRSVLVCDTSYPYAGPYTADTTAQLTGDSPLLKRPSSIFRQVARDEAYIMYVMYKPPTANSIWVSVKRLVWQVEFCAAPPAKNGLWVVQQQNNAIVVGWTDAFVNPAWTQNAHQFTTSNVPEQAPCAP